MLIGMKLQYAGLSSNEVARRTALDQSNRLSVTTSRSIWSILRANLFTNFNIIVLGSCIILLVIGLWRDAIFGFAAIGNIVIGVWQEYRAKKMLDSLTVLHTPMTAVVRNGAVVTIPSEQIVVGDILSLKIGDEIPADVTILDSGDLETNEALLTGESEPVVKLKGDIGLSGSAVVAGSGFARVTRVGADSFANRISIEAKHFSLVNSELRSSLRRILRWISFALVPIISIVIYGQIMAAGGWSSLSDTATLYLVLQGVIASVVAMIPLGLVLLTSLALTVGAMRLARHDVLVQEIAAVEGLARADVVCFDKTGTLTEGQIVFDQVIHLDSTHGLSWSPIIGWLASQEASNATTRALAAHFSAVDHLSIASTVPFSSSRKWSAVSVVNGPSAGSWVFGAPERIIPLDAARHTELSRTIESLTASGHRVLVLAFATEAQYDSRSRIDLRQDRYQPIVIISLKETIRSDTFATLAYLRQQGVAIKLLSGDNPSTVAAIAREAGIEFAGAGYNAKKLPRSIPAIAKILESHMIFGRVDPDQKRDIIKALQSQGHTVAMVGDGVNDIMALKQADIGVAMGSGVPAARTVANVILLRSEFSQFPQIIAAGRQVIANVERVAVLFLTKTVYIMVLSIVLGALAWGFPFLPRQLSFIDGITLGIPAFFLALLPGSPRALHGFLRRTLQRVVPMGIIVAGSVILLNAYVRTTNLHDLAAIQTTFVITLALLGLWVLSMQARPIERWRFVLVMAMYASLFVALVTPIIRDFFGLKLPPLAFIATAITVAVIGSIGIEFVRWRFRLIKK